MRDARIGGRRLRDLRLRDLRPRGLRPKDAAFGAVAVVLALVWIVAAIRVWPAIALAPRPSPTARPSTDVEVARLPGRIAIAAEGDVFVIHDGKLSAIATGGGRHDPALSPDGARLAYVQDASVDGKKVVDGQVVPAHLAYSSVVVRASSGGPDETLVNGVQRRDPNGYDVVEFESQPAWSADGADLAFVSDGGAGADLQVITLATKRIATLSVGSILADPAWSPDGKTIAVTSYTQGTPMIRLVPADGRTQATTLKVARDGDPYRPSFSPDGGWLLVTLRTARGNDLVAVEVSSGRVIDVTTDGRSWGGVFSPDGSQVAFLREHDGDIDLFALDVGALLRTGAAPTDAVQVTHDGRLDGTSRPSWSR